MTELATPYFMIHEDKLVKNLEKCAQLKALSGVKLVLALKCFSTWGVFKIMEPYLDGTTSSGPYEVMLGHETFGKETHAYSVGYSEDDVKEVATGYECGLNIENFNDIKEGDIIEGYEEIEVKRTL